MLQNFPTNSPQNPADSPKISNKVAGAFTQKFTAVEYITARRSKHTDEQYSGAPEGAGQAAGCAGSGSSIVEQRHGGNHGIFEKVLNHGL